MREAVLIEGTGIQPLPEETIVETFSDRAKKNTIYLTTWRLIFAGRKPFLFILPGDEVILLAMLRDVDFVGMVARRLPAWALLLGLALFIGGIAGTAQGLPDGPAALMILAGLGLTIFWLLFKRRLLIFTVSGEQRYEFLYGLFPAPVEMREMDAFVSSFFRQKWEAALRMPPVGQPTS